jgi:hypothetical protein
MGLMTLSLKLAILQALPLVIPDRIKPKNLEKILPECHFFFTTALPAHSGSKPLIQFRNHFSQTVGLFGRGISLSQAST